MSKTTWAQTMCQRRDTPFGPTFLVVWLLCVHGDVVVLVMMAVPVIAVPCERPNPGVVMVVTVYL